MSTIEQKRTVLEDMTELLELPEMAYQKAKERYEDIGEWLGRDGSACEGNEPHIFPQGSFRLGTAIRPLDESEAYDLDLACRLQLGLSKSSHTQQDIKTLVGGEIEKYREARGIKAPKEEKHRCWRLEYADKLSFHMDIVPCIPDDETGQRLMSESMTKAGENKLIADSVSKLTVSITDDRHPRYRTLCDDWNVSNPEGYAVWFEDRMNQMQQMYFEKAQVDEIPIYKRKTPLQRVIQLLKRHRDQMFKDDPDVKPISIIITTLAARAYQGEADIESALRNILARMGDLVNQKQPRVPNPVNPNEDFADRWSMPENKDMHLEQNFRNWLRQAKVDFDLIGSTDDVMFLSEQAAQKFSVRFDAENLKKKLGISTAAFTVAPKSHSISGPSKPWRTDR